MFLYKNIKTKFNLYLTLNIFYFSALTLLIGFYYNEDGTGLALSGDFRDTLPYVVELKKNLLDIAT